MPRTLMLLLCLFVHAAGAEPLRLVEEGEPRASIHLRAGASPVEAYAAEELQTHLHKISGANVPIQTGREEKGAAILIAALEEDAALADRLGIDPTALGEEETLIRREGESLYLVGRTPRAALYATYTFLQDHLGCRWFWPGPEGEYLPSLRTIEIGALNERQRPGLAVRSFGINHPHYDEATDIWMARQRLNVRHLQSRFPKDAPEQLHRRGFRVAIAGHNLTLPQRELEAHPQWAAEIAGKRSAARVGRRQPHLCWSNPGVQQALVAQLSQWLAEHPQVDTLSLSATDHTLFCECAECRSMAADVSTRWQELCALLIARIKPSHPRVSFWALAYQAYRDVPHRAAPLDYVGYCAYNADYLRPLLQSPEANAALKQDLLAWKARGLPVGLRGYELIAFAEPMWTPLLRYTVEEKQWLHAHGLAGSYSEVAPYGHPLDKPAEQQGWVANRLTIYAAAQALWNPTLPPEAILTDWMQTLYGPAAEPMLAHYRLLESAWLGLEQPLTYFLHPPVAFAGKFLTPERISTASEHLQIARKLAQGEPRRLAQIELEARLFARWQSAYLYHEGRKHHGEAWALRLPEPAASFPAETAWAEAPALPAFEDRTGALAAEPTEVRLLWDAQALYLRIRCADSAPEQLVAKYSGHDENLFGDDSVELFLQPDETPGYAHLGFNFVGARYDARHLPGSGPDPAWNPHWSVATRRTATGWEADVTLPFQSFGGTPPAENGLLRLALKRSRPATRRQANPALLNTGWPDASYHNAHALGRVSLLHTAPKRHEVVVYHGGAPAVNLVGELVRRDFTVTSVETGEAALAEALERKPAMILIRCTRQTGLSAEWLHDHLRAYLEAGGIAVLSAAGPLPLERWLGDPGLAVAWSGWGVDRRRRTHFVAQGAWTAEPHDLRPAFQRRVSPASGYLPAEPGRWQVLAASRLEDERECPYLLATPIGSGMLYLTSSNMGYSGGGEIFGRHHPGNAAALLGNLLNARRR